MHLLVRPEGRLDEGRLDWDLLVSHLLVSYPVDSPGGVVIVPEPFAFDADSPD